MTNPFLSGIRSLGFRPLPMRALLMTLATLFLWPSVAGALDIDPDAPFHRIDDQILYQVEPEGEALELDELRLTSRHLQWETLDGPINFGFSYGAIWYRLDLRHPLNRSLPQYLEIDNALLRDVRFFHVVDDQIVADFQTGAARPYPQRPIDHRNFVFPLELQPGQTNEIFIRIRTSGSHRAPLTLWQPQSFLKDSGREMLRFGLLYGTILVMAAFNLLLFAGLRDTTYLFLAGAVASLALVLSLTHGTAYQFLFPDWPRLEYRMVAVSVPLMTLLFLSFSVRFMGLREQLSRTRSVIRLLFVVTVAVFLSALFLPYGLAARLAAIVLAAVCLALLAVASIQSIRGDRNARFFLLTWCILLLGAFSKVLAFAGLVNHRFLSDYAMEAGAAAVSLLFSLALADQFHRERRNHLSAIAEREKTERRLLDATRRHSVSNLPNRGVLEHSLDIRIGRSQSRDDKLALVLLHLRDFDEINRTLGHHNADRMLRQLARQLDRAAMEIAEHIRLEDETDHRHAVAHIEGVTFGCAFHVTSHEEAQAIMRHLSECLARPVELEGLELSLSAVLGCAFYPDDSPDAATLLRHAFIAYGSADVDVNHIAIFKEDDIAYNARRLTLMTDLKQAIESNQLSLVFQPQVRCENGELFGFEALLRWRHDRHGFVSPDEFIPMAERSGLMPALTEWVLNQALDFQRQAEGAGAVSSISVNISPINLRDADFVDMVRRSLKSRNIEPHRLVLEVTETAAMRQPRHTLATLRKVNDMGVQISIDDFGTGYSSLEYLRRMPVQEVKIDRSFVTKIDRNQDDLTIVRTISHMCHDLGYRIVAEGVESEVASQMVCELDCDVIQGYFLARPLAKDRAFEWIDRQYPPDP